MANVNYSSLPRCRAMAHADANALASPRSTAAASAPCAAASLLAPSTRGVHSYTFQLNLSTLYEIGGARRGYVARVKGVLGGVQGVQGVFIYQTRLKFS